MNVKEVLGAFLLVNNPIVLSEEETKDVQKAIKQLQQENQKYKEVIDKLEKKIKSVKQYDFDRVGRCELLDVLKEVK